jgi:peptide/nickel transport system substrate-binding protein
MKRHSLLLLAVILLATACGGSASDRRPDTIVIGIEQDATTLDPRLASDAYSARLSALIFNGLLRLDRDGRLVPDLAERYDTPDARTFVFHLRDGVRFHDGTPFTSADVAYTVESIRDPATRSPRKAAFDVVSAVETPDARTVTFRLSRPFAPFLTAATAGIVPKGIAGKPADAFGRKPIGTGPYRLGAWETNSGIRLEANPGYHAGAPRIAHLLFRVIPNDTTRLLELRKGSVDLVQNAIPAYAVKFLKQDPALRVVTRPGINFSYLGFNMRDPLLSRREVREAVARAIDREAIITHVLEGLATPAKGLLAPANWAYADDVETYPHDPARARALLAGAGIAPGSPGAAIVYKTSTNKERVAIGEAIVQSLREAGIDARLRSLEFGTLYADVRTGNFQMFGLTWVGVTDPDILYNAFHSKSVPPDGANRGRYANPRVDALLERAREIPGEAERRTLYAEAQRLIAHDLPYVPLWYTHDVAAMRKRLVSYEPYPSGDFTGLLSASLAP